MVTSLPRSCPSWATWFTRAFWLAIIWRPRLLGRTLSNHSTLCSQKQVFKTLFPLGSSCFPAKPGKPDSSSFSAAALRSRKGLTLCLLPERGSPREWLTLGPSRTHSWLAAPSDVKGRASAVEGVEPSSARAQIECAGPRGRCPAASPASAILLLWLLGAGWVRLLGRRDSCWSAVLRVTAGIGAGSWGCGAGGGFQDRSHWSLPCTPASWEARGGLRYCSASPTSTPGLCPVFPDRLSVRRPGAGGRWRRMLRGPEPRGTSWPSPLIVPRSVLRGPSSTPKPTAGKGFPSKRAADAAHPRAQHHVLRQVWFFRPLCLVHGASDSPGGADSSPRPAPWHVPSPGLIYLPRGLCTVRVRELACLALHHQLPAQPPL